MPAPPDVKIETVSIAPGIYMLVGRGGNVGPHGRSRWRGHHRRPVRRHGAEDPRRGGDAVDQPVKLRDQHAPARRSHRRQRRLRQVGRGDHRARKRAQASRHGAGESVDQHADPGARARSAAGGHVRRFGDAAFQRRRPASSRTCRMRTPTTDIVVRFRKANVAAHGRLLHRRLPVHRRQHRRHARRPDPRTRNGAADGRRRRRRSFAAMGRSATRRSCRRTTTCSWWCATASRNS